MNPHTHQLKICDFGSAKLLVRFIGPVFKESICGYDQKRTYSPYRWKENPIYLTSAPDTIVLQNSFLAPANTQLQLIYGPLVAWWLNCFLDRLKLKKISSYMIFVIIILFLPSLNYFLSLLTCRTASVSWWKRSRSACWNHQGNLLLVLQKCISNLEHISCLGLTMTNKCLARDYVYKSFVYLYASASLHIAKFIFEWNQWMLDLWVTVYYVYCWVHFEYKKGSNEFDCSV